MERNKEEAFRAKETAEKRFVEKDFTSAKKYAVKAQTLYPELEGISQMLATFDVYVASMVQINGETDFYSVLGLNYLADEDAVKKQYRKLALILHPDKNKTVGADGAFKLVSEAWSLLSDSDKRTSYNIRRSKQSSAGVSHSNPSVVQTPGVNGSSKRSKIMNSHNQPKRHTFWTVCTSCKVQYEYLRKYLNNRLSCKNCHGTFMAVETGKAPVNGSIPFRSWPYPEYGHASQVTYVPADTIFFAGSGVPGFHTGFRPEYPNVGFQWSPFPGTSSRIVGAHGSTTASTGVAHRASEKKKRTGEKMKTAARDKDPLKNKGNMASNMSPCYNKPPGSKADRPDKKRKIDGEDITGNGFEVGPKSTNPEARMANGYGKTGVNVVSLSASEAPIRRSSVALAFDARQLLIDKARTEIRKKLEEMKLAAAAAAAAEEKAKVQKKVDVPEELPSRVDPNMLVDQSECNKPGSISITVPDSDFHDFDKERSEGCFKPKQIWALYDEDGMPRLYCLVREVISVKPFKIHISYLNSKSDSEFGLVNWVDSGFTKSCGHFKAWNSDIIDQVNIFSHVICGEKVRRGGSIQIFPKRGDIWAVYRNWSPDWNRTTPDEVRHQYEMVEVLDDYTEKLGVCATPLVKVDGFKTVYRRKVGQNAIQWIPRREMLRFSHQVPSYLLRGEASTVPDGCWDLDPAATPEELLQAVAEATTDTNSVLAEK